jgi:DNA-3-methyladenine glycosylase II
MSAVNVQVGGIDRRSSSSSRRTVKRKARPLAGGLSECRTAKKYPVESSPFKLADNTTEVLKTQEELDEALEDLKSRDEKLAELINTYSPPHFLLGQAGEPFEYLCRSLIEHQISTKSAQAICSKFIIRFSVREGQFPTPSQVCKGTDDELKAAGLSARKMSYIQDLARKFDSGEIETEMLMNTGNNDCHKILTQVKGIGTWIVDMFLLFCLKRQDVLPLADLGVRRGFQKFFNLSALPQPEQMLHLAKAWEPYRSIGTWYMWRLAAASIQ